MLFKKIPGHELLKARLIKNVRTGKMAHARLFLGPEGSGSLALALAYSQYILCQDPSETDSCGVCSACLKNQKLIHPDLHFSFPFVGGKKDDHANLYIKQWRKALIENPFLSLEAWIRELSVENKQLNISIHECHEIHAKLSMKPFEGSFQILIMWLPEFLGKEGNSLLKLIEEPGKQTLLIFVAENTDAVLGTILSRTQLVKINAFDDKEISSFLINQYNLSITEAGSLAFLSEGNLGMAIDLVTLQKEDFGPSFTTWIALCQQGNLSKIVSWVEQISRSGKEGPGREARKGLLHYGLKMIREALLLSEGAESLLRSFHENKESTHWFRYINASNANFIIQDLDQAIYHIERNANPKILFLDVSLRLHEFLNMPLRVQNT